ncbi:hypothetical protein MaudCBS49596_006913 [Microsporum audouinii]
MQGRFDYTTPLRQYQTRFATLRLHSRKATFVKMGSENYESTVPPYASTTCSSVYTPASETTLNNGLWDGYYYTVPWPDNTYLILEKGTKRAITFEQEAVILQDVNEEGQRAAQEWHCVSKDNYFAFYNPKSGKYMGHDGGDYIFAKATEPKAWECITATQHPEGGYRLSMPHYWEWLRVVTVADNGKNLSRRVHGTTLWDFVKV